MTRPRPSRNSWIHCVACGVQDDEKDDVSSPPGFLVASCSHLHCELCLVDESTCRVCGTDLVAADAVPAVEHERTSTDVNEAFVNVMDNYSFQRSHALNLVRLRRQEMVRLDHLIDEAAKQCSKLEALLADLREQKRKLLDTDGSKTLAAKYPDDGHRHDN